MGVYRISDLHNRLCEMANDGYEYTDICVLDQDEDSPESLCFEVLEDSCSAVDYETVESCEFPDDYYYLQKSTRSVCATDYCTEINFTYEEIALIKHSVDNALAYFKDLLEDSTQSKDIVKEIKQSSIECRNLQAKLAKFLKRLH